MLWWGHSAQGWVPELTVNGIGSIDQRIGYFRFDWISSFKFQMENAITLKPKFEASTWFTWVTCTTYTPNTEVLKVVLTGIIGSMDHIKMHWMLSFLQQWNEIVLTPRPKPSGHLTRHHTILLVFSCCANLVNWTSLTDNLTKVVRCPLAGTVCKGKLTYCFLQMRLVVQ